MNLRRPEEAELAYAAARTLAPGKTGAIEYQRGKALYRAGRYNEAVEAFRTVLASNWGQFNVRHWIGLAAFGGCDYRLALWGFIESRNVDDRTDSIYFIGRCAYAVGNCDLAEKHIQAAIDKLLAKYRSQGSDRKEPAEWTHYLGRAQWGQGKRQEAMKNLEDAFDRDKTPRHARWLFQACIAQGDLHRAVDVCKRFGKAGKPPEGMKGLEWAHLCDDYFWQKADMQADFAATGDRLKRQMDRRTAALAKALADAREHAESVRKQWNDFSAGQRKLMARAMAWKLHQARLLAARQALADLKKLQADLEGSAKARDDAIEAEGIESSGYLLPDKLRTLVLREMQLADATRFPPRADLDNGLPQRDWQGIFAQPARQEAKVKWMTEQLRLANEELRHAAARVQAGGDAQLRRMRAEGEGPEAVRRKATELADSRKRRIRQREDDARKDADEFRKALAKETAALDKMRTPTTAPAPGATSRPR